MCGIVGYIGHREAYPIVIKGLQRLEYRGYDSAGIALYDGNSIKLSKTKGKVSDLKNKIETRFHWHDSYIEWQGCQAQVKSKSRANEK